MEKIKLKVRSGDPGECVDQSAAVTTRALVTMTTSAARYLLLMVDCSNPGECVDHVNAQLGHNSGTSREFVAHVCAVQHRTRRPTSGRIQGSFFKRTRCSLTSVKTGFTRLQP
jgi:hypothetical protein